MVRLGIQEGPELAPQMLGLTIHRTIPSENRPLGWRCWLWEAGEGSWMGLNPGLSLRAGSEPTPLRSSLRSRASGTARAEPTGVHRSRPRGPDTLRLD